MSARGKIDRSIDGRVFESPDQQPGFGDRRRRTGIFRVIFQESLDTLILGALSTSLGAVLILVPLLDTMQSGVRIDLPLSTYLALVPIGASLGFIGIFRARMMNRFTSPLSTLGALLCFLPASPLILGSAGIYILIMAPFAIAFYGSALDRETRPAGGLETRIGRRGFRRKRPRRILRDCGRLAISDQRATYPPLMKIVCAVIQPPSGDTKSFTSGTMSLTSPSLPLMLMLL